MKYNDICLFTYVNSEDEYFLRSLNFDFVFKMKDGIVYYTINKIDYIKYFRDFIYKDKETFLERKFIIFESIDDNYKRDYSQTKRDRKKYIITDPDGKIFVIENLNKFCKENRLIYSTMSNLSRGIGNSNKGWKCEFKK